MIRYNGTNGIKTGFGCKVQTIQDGPWGNIRSDYWECDTLAEAVRQFRKLLRTNYNVTLFGDKYFSPKTYGTEWDLNMLLKRLKSYGIAC